VSVLVFIEQREGQVRSVSREALGEATRLAASLGGGEVVGVCAAASDPGLAALGDAGADRVLLAAHPGFARYDGAGYAAAVAAAALAVKPAAVLFAASSLGRDLAPRVAAKLGAGLAADCTSLTATDGALTATRPVYAGKAIQTVRFPKSPALVSLRPKVFAPVTGAGKRGAVEPLVSSRRLPARACARSSRNRAARWTSPSPRSSFRAVAGSRGRSTSS